MTNPDFMQLGKSFGFKSLRVTSIPALARSIKRAFAADTPVVIEAAIEFASREFSV